MSKGEENVLKKENRPLRKQSKKLLSKIDQSSEGSSEPYDLKSDGDKDFISQFVTTKSCESQESTPPKNNVVKKPRVL